MIKQQTNFATLKNARQIGPVIYIKLTQDREQRVWQFANPPNDSSTKVSPQRRRCELEPATTERAAVSRTSLQSTSLQLHFSFATASTSTSQTTFCSLLLSTLLLQLHWRRYAPSLTAFFRRLRKQYRLIVIANNSLSEHQRENSTTVTTHGPTLAVIY